MKKTEKEKFKEYYEKVDGGYELIKCYSVELHSNFPDIECDKCEIRNNYLTIYTGFFWNGITGYFDLHSLMRGGCVHDALYYMLGEIKRNKKRYRNIKIDRKYCDKELLNIIREDRCNIILSNSVYFSVRVFGGAFV